MIDGVARPPRQRHGHHVLQPGRRPGPRDRRRLHRQGPARRLGLRERAADGPDEPHHLGGRHAVHPVGVGQLVPRVEADPRDRPLRRRRRRDGARRRWPSASRRSTHRERLRRPRRASTCPTRRAAPSTTRAETEELLLAARATSIEAARPMPLSTSAMITKDEVLELLDEAIARLPEELRAARWLLKEREEFLAKVRARGRRHPRAGPHPGRAHGAAHRGRQGGRAAGPPDRRDGRGRGPPPAPRGRGLLRPEAGQLRDRARAHAEARSRSGRAEAAGPCADRRTRRTTSPTSAQLGAHGDPSGTGVLRPGPRLSAGGPPACGSGVADLLRRPRAPAATFRDQIALAGPRRVSDAGWPDDADVDVDARRSSRFERRHRRSPARSRCRGPGECRRCLDPVAGRSTVRACSEIFERAPDRAARPTRSATTRSTSSRWSATPSLLALPLAPLCGRDCAGPGARRVPDAVERRRRRASRRRRPPLGRPRRARASTTDRGPGSTRRPAGSPATISRLRCRALAPAPPTVSTLRHRDHGRPQEEDLQGEEPQPPGLRLDASRRPARSTCPRCGAAKLPARRVRQLRLVPRPPGHRRRLIRRRS